MAAATVLPGCSSAFPPKAIEAWNGPDAKGALLDGDVRHWILSYAILAPHAHNLQSWLVDLRQPNEITLYCDSTRLLPDTDPWSRQMMLSQGTFLELLAMAARQKGVRADITLYPKGEFDAYKVDARPTAHIRLSPDASLQPDPLFAQIVRRRTNREIYEPRNPVPEALDAIASAALAAPNNTKTRVGFVDAQQMPLMERHRAIAMEAWRIELQTPRTIMESYRLLRIGPAEIEQFRDGISINKPMLRALAGLGLFDRSKVPGPDDSSTVSQIKEFNEKISTTPAFFWMVTEGNSRSTQIQAGRAYVRAQLAATQHGLSMHPLSQALQEYPEQSKTYADIHALLNAPQATHTVQMWTRLGYAPTIEPSPRRGLAAHIIKT